MTVGFRGDDATWTLLDQVSAIARRVGASLRLVTFAVRKSTMYPPRGVSDAEDMVHVQWQEQARRELTEAIAHLRQSGFADDQVESQLAAARSWGGAMDALEWGRNDLLVVGSSSSGLLGRVALGSVTDRLVHTAVVPVAIAPRGYPATPEPLTRITAAYGAEADLNGLVAAAAGLAKAWSIPMRIVSFSVRPFSIEPAENLVVGQWAQRMEHEVTEQLNKVRQNFAVPDVDVVVGTGRTWRDAVEGVPWESGELLALGSGAAGAISHVFLGSAAAKIVRHSSVPVLIMPRQ